MDESEARKVVVEALAGANGIPVKLRRKDGLDEEQLDRVRKAAALLARAYEGREEIPRDLALAFLDIRTSMESGLGLYPEQAQDAIQDAAEELVELGLDLFGADEGG
jgi:hypothetical protein